MLTSGAFDEAEELSWRGRGLSQAVLSWFRNICQFQTTTNSWLAASWQKDEVKHIGNIRHTHLPQYHVLLQEFQ